MARRKLTEEQKKSKITITINKDLSKLLQKYIDTEYPNTKSKYVENLIKEDMVKRGINLKNDF